MYIDLQASRSVQKNQSFFQFTVTDKEVFGTIFQLVWFLLIKARIIVINYFTLVPVKVVDIYLTASGLS